MLGQIVFKGINFVAARKTPSVPEPDEQPAFEDALRELSSIVGSLEDGSLPLEESMLQFERGIGLLRNCYSVLEQAEQRIEILTSVSEDGSVETTAFDAEATFDAKSGGGSKPARKAAKRETPSREIPGRDDFLF
jgi:exodeoxyribonuclease VII small subunit